MIIGIDLGTTNSLVSYFKDGKPTLIPNALGSVLTPSVVSVDNDGKILVGQPAKDRLISHPTATASTFKRFMGSQKVYTLTADKHTQKFSPEELSALILKSLKQDATAHLGQEVRDVVITVPAYFNDHQRESTKTSAMLAGLNVVRLINEPTSASMAYGLHEYDSDEERKFLVLDLGGGTFDVTLLELFAGVMEVKASAGDNLLGGEDFTEVIIKDFIRHHESQGTPSHFWQAHHAMLYDESERAKRTLSDHDTAQIHLSIDGKVYDYTLTSDDFEELCQPLFAKITAPIERAVRDAGLKVRDLDAIVLVGGSTRMPLFKKMIAKLLGRFPTATLNPDEAIAIGASIQAGLIAEDNALDELVLTDVSPYSLGVETSIQVSEHERRSGIFSPIIERNTIIPTSRVENFSPVHNDQTEVRFGIYQGEARLVKDNIQLGELTVKVPKEYQGKATQLSIDVRFSYDVNGLLEVDIDAGGKQHNLTIENGAKRLTEKELQASKDKLSALKIHPRDTIESRALIARAERLYSQRLGHDRDEIGRLLAWFENVLDSQDTDKIRHSQVKFGEFLDNIENRDDWR